MKRLSIIWIQFIILFLTKSVHGQSTFVLPDSIALNSKSDYLKYEKTIINASKWIQETDLDKEYDKRSQINTFLLKWVEGSPNVSVIISPALAKIYGKNNQLLIVYMAGFAANEIQHNYYSNKQASIFSGVKAMIAVYRKGILIKKSSEMEKLLKISDSEIVNYIDQNLQ